MTADGKQHVLPGVIVLAVTALHGIYVTRTLGPDFLFSMCFLANMILGAGIIFRSAWLTGTGFGWALIALPLWVFHSYITGQVYLSSIAFHVTGVCAGVLALRRMKLPQWLVLAAVPAGVLSVTLARLFTDPVHNINAAFRVQTGWESVFPGHISSMLAQLCAYSLIFLAVPSLGNRLLHRHAEEKA